MGVEAVTGTPATVQSASAEASKKATLDYDTFLKLLIAQMQNQDPTDPMDATEQVAQLATFSQVEQTIETNKNLESLIQSSMFSQAGTIVGKTVTSADGFIKGVVEQVKINSDGVVATLESGEEVTVESGVTISGS